MKRMLRRLFGRSGTGTVVVPAGEHKIKAEAFSAEVLEVAKQLQAEGYAAYVVGGAVRDLLLGFHPKDFDIATDATPAQIQAVFRRRSRMVGRRFPIVHVYAPRRRQQRYGSTYTEVTTFRGTSDNPQSKRHYGSAEQDAQRRDFTINGLFYDSATRKIYDYVGGVADLRAKKLRMIGASKKRLPEDPVRILRALRFSTKLGLMMSSQLEQQLARCAPLLADIPKARLFDEFIKVVNSGASARIFKQWQQFGVCPHVMPILQQDNPLFFSVAAENDRRHAEGRATSVSFIVAALFWQQLAQEWQVLRSKGMAPVQAMQEAIATLPQRDNAAIPQRLMGRAKDLYFLQAQMESSPTPRRARSTMNKPLFDRALAFASLRQDDGAAQTASWWSQFTQGSEEERNRMLQSIPREKRRRRKKPAV